jgi:RHS repeat-associated protein
VTYGFDADGLVTYVEDQTVPDAPVRDTYAYDGRHRLAAAAGPGGAHSYAYDDAGTTTFRDGVAYERDDPFRRQRITRTGASGWFTYDALGATTAMHGSGGDRFMTYDTAGRLVRFATGDGGLVITSDYDASGLPVRETTDRPSGRSILVTPFPGVEIRDGRITANVQVGDLRVLTLAPDGTVQVPVVDHLGTARAIVGFGQSAATRARYGPYGEAAANPTLPDGWLRFGAARVQDGSGLVVMGWRHYDPALGRFLEPDPLVGSPLDTQALNRYAYARDNPVNLNDPDGRNPLVAVLFIGALALLDRDTRADVGRSVALTAASILLTGVLGPGWGAGVAALRSSTPALYAAAASTVILDSRLGQGIIDSYASLLEDAGLSRRAAGIGGNLAAGWLLNSHLQRAAASGLAGNGRVHSGASLGDRSSLEAGLAERGIETNSLRTPSGDAYGTTVLDVSTPGISRELDRFNELVDDSGNVIGVYGVRDLGPMFDHGAAGICGPGGAGGIASSGAHFTYGLGGISTQQFSRDLFAAGYSGSLFTLTGRTSDFMIELVWGPYGGGLAFGVGMATSNTRPAEGGP